MFKEDISRKARLSRGHCLHLVVDHPNNINLDRRLVLLHQTRLNSDFVPHWESHNFATRKLRLENYNI